MVSNKISTRSTRFAKKNGSKQKQNYGLYKVDGPKTNNSKAKKPKRLNQNERKTRQAANAKLEAEEFKKEQLEEQRKLYEIKRFGRELINRGTFGPSPPRQSTNPQHTQRSTYPDNEEREFNEWLQRSNRSPTKQNTRSTSPSPIDPHKAPGHRRPRRYN